MKNLLSLLVAISLYVASHAQSANFLTDKVTGNFYKTADRSEVEGSPFFLTDWVPGIIYLKDGYKADKFLLKLDLYSNELLFQHDGAALVVVNPVKEFVLMPASNGGYLFRCGYLPVDKNTETTYYRVLQDGPTALLKLTRKYIKEKKEYNQPVTREFEENETYYIVKAGRQPEKIKKDRTSIVTAIGDGNGKLMAWAEKKGLKCKTEEDMMTVVKAFNENSYQ